MAGRRSTGEIVILAALSGAVCLGISSASATTFYVSVDHGSDQASGLTPALAFQTPGAITDRLQPGDRLVIEAGRYDQPLRITRSGTAGAEIEIGGVEGALPLIRSTTDAVVVTADFVRLSRIDAASEGDLGSAIVVQPGHHHVTIIDTVAHDSGCAGIAGMQTDFLTIRHNRVFGNGGRSPWQCSGISIYQAANIDDSPGVHNVIDGNIVYANMDKVPDPNLPAPLAGHTTDGNGIIIDDFRHDQVWQGRKTAPYRSATLVENNVVHDNGGRGIEVFRSDDVTIVNNTSLGDLLDLHMVRGEYGEIYVAFASRIRLFNNIIVPGSAGAAAVMAANADAVRADYNVTVGGSRGLGQKASEIEWGSHNFEAASAGFRDDRARDLHLTSVSQALNRGAAAGAPGLDLDANRRPQAGTVDAGAYQSTP